MTVIQKVVICSPELLFVLGFLLFYGASWIRKNKKERKKISLKDKESAIYKSFLKKLEIKN
jgi:uncharacterized membrane protein